MKNWLFQDAPARASDSPRAAQERERPDQPVGTPLELPPLASLRQFFIKNSCPGMLKKCRGYSSGTDAVGIARERTSPNAAARLGNRAFRLTRQRGGFSAPLASLPHVASCFFITEMERAA